MTRPLRIEFPGAIYHLTARGNGRAAIFLDDFDREVFLSVLGEVVGRYNWICHAYCLMSNHYHILIETPDCNLSQGMRNLNGIYTQKFNRRHGRVGHVFQGRFKSILSASKRDRAIAKAHLEHGYSQREIAAHVGLHYSTVSRRARRERAARI